MNIIKVYFFDAVIVVFINKERKSIGLFKLFISFEETLKVLLLFIFFIIIILMNFCILKINILKNINKIIIKYLKK